MPKKMKWALVCSWRNVHEFATKAEAEAALTSWKEDMEALPGWTVSGSKSKGHYTARAPGADYQTELTAVQAGERPKHVVAAVIMKVEEVRFETD